MTQPLAPLLEKALNSRADLFNAPHDSAFRIFNGFTEGQPLLSLDLYAGTILFHNYHANAAEGLALVKEAQSFIQKHSLFSRWLRAGIVKSRSSSSPNERRGSLLFGEKPDRKIKEHGVWYAVDLLMNQDAGFYLDTGNLRKWLIENMAGKSVLNTFAYTGSLGVAVTAAGSARVVQLDRNRRFLNLAKDSYSLNGFAINRSDFISADFFPAVSKFKKTNQLFDCVILDPPFFSRTSNGRVDQENDRRRLINKVRPLIKDGGTLIAINNALYISGKEYMETLESLCQGGYLKIRQLIPVPEDFTGYNKSAVPLTDPAPFNHSTKIAVLEVKKKQDNYKSLNG